MTVAALTRIYAEAAQAYESAQRWIVEAKTDRQRNNATQVARYAKALKISASAAIAEFETDAH